MRYLLYLAFCLISFSILFCSSFFCSTHLLKKSAEVGSVIVSILLTTGEIVFGIISVGHKINTKAYLYTHICVLKPKNHPALTLTFTLAYLTWHRYVTVGWVVWLVVVGSDFCPLPALFKSNFTLLDLMMVNCFDLIIVIFVMVLISVVKIESSLSYS